MVTKRRGRNKGKLLKFWGERCIWPQHRSVSIPETAWSNREWSQTKHLDFSLARRSRAAALPRSHCKQSVHQPKTLRKVLFQRGYRHLLALWPPQMKKSLPGTPYHRLHYVRQWWAVKLQSSLFYCFILITFRSLRTRILFGINLFFLVVLPC